MCSLFISGNGPHEYIQENRFNKFQKERQPRPDPEKVIFNISDIFLSSEEKSFLVKGLTFSIPPRKLNYADYVINVALFYRSIF